MVKIDILLNAINKRENDFIELFYMDLEEYYSAEQIVIIKYKMKGYKNIEIAKKLSVCPATITKRIKDIKKILRGYLKDGFK